MKERPILFSGPMVRAILEGRKTQTRRVVKPQPDISIDSFLPADPSGFWGFNGSYPVGCIHCPQGEPGDRLWVRETWKLWEDPEDGHDFILYDAGGKMSFPNEPNLPMPNDPFSDRWRPSIHMFRWMSRITLEVKSVRVERLHGISHRDALAEGVTYDVSKPDGAPLHRFKTLWDSINGEKYPWKSNPWLWVVEFERV